MTRVIPFWLLIAVLCIVVVPLAGLAQKRGKLYPLVAAAVVLSLAAGLRASWVGKDTLPYLESVRYFLRTGETVWGMVTFSDGYGVLASSLLRLWDNESFLLLVQSLLTNVPMLLRFWDYKDESDLPFTVFAYIVLVYPLCFCLSCQMLAVSIFFYSMRWLDKDKYLPFCLGWVAAILIHKSALIGVFALVPRFHAAILKRCSGDRRRANTIFAAFVFVGSILVLGLIGSAFSNYFRNFRLSVGFMAPARAIFFTLVIVILHLQGVAGVRENEKMRPELKYYYFAIALSAVSYIVPNGGRIAYYYVCFGPVSYGLLLRRLLGTFGEPATRLLVGVVLCISFVYVFLMNDNMGINNFGFYWM